MLVSRLIPILMLGGVGFHSGGAIKDRVKSAFGVGEQVAVRQRIVTIMEAARLHVSSGEQLSFRSDAAFRAFVKKQIRLRGNAKGDASLDLWGTPLRGKLTRQNLTITSAGPDKRFSTKDDITDTQNVFDY